MPSYSLARIEQIRVSMRPIVVKMDPISLLMQECPGFKPTRVKRPRDNKAKIIQLANKLSVSNLDVTQTAVSKVLEEDGYSKKLIGTLLEALSSSSLTSKLGSQVCLHSCILSPVVRTEIEEFIDSFYTSLSSLSPLPESPSYDDLCRSNKANDSNVARSIFVVNLQLALGYEHDEVRQRVNMLLDLLLERANQPGEESVCLHLTEILYHILTAKDSILIDQSMISILKRLDFDWAKSAESAPSKTVFRVMDILDTC